MTLFILVIDPAAVGNMGIDGSSGGVAVTSGGILTTEGTASIAFTHVRSPTRPH